MTKQEMINIILDEEKILWDKLQSSIGSSDYEVTNAIRNQWYAINRLVQVFELNKQ